MATLKSTDIIGNLTINGSAYIQENLYSGSGEVTGDIQAATKAYIDQFKPEDWKPVPLEANVAPGTYGTRNTPSYRKVGNHVYIEGGVSISERIGTSSYRIGVLPTGYRPLKNVYRLKAGTAQRVYRVYINTSGLLILEWAFNLTTNVQHQGTVSWVQIDMDYWIDS